MGGSWLGVLAVDDESAASILANCEGAWEVTPEVADALKKKLAGTTRALTPSKQPQPLPQVLESVAHVVRPTADTEATVGGKKSSAPLASVELLTTELNPPFEPILSEIGHKRRRAA